jgi:hypothetical protein
LKEKASLLLDQCDDEEEEEKITRNLENELDALENQANANKLHFQQQFTNDQQKQSDKMKARLQKKYNKKMAKLNKSKKKIELTVRIDNENQKSGMGDGDHSKMLLLQQQIYQLENRTKDGQDELDALIEANAADSRMLLSQAIAGQTNAHSKLEKRLQDRKKQRKEKDRLADEINGHVDITSIGGIKGSLTTLRNRNALKDATQRLLTARQQVAMAKEHVGFKKNVAGVKDERDLRINIEEREEVANGMALLEAQQASARRSRELLLEAEVEKGKVKERYKGELKYENLNSSSLQPFLTFFSFFLFFFCFFFLFFFLTFS